MKLFGFFCLIITMLVGCKFFSTGSIQSNIHLNPKEDKTYYLAMKEMTRSHQVYSTFETIYFINVTYFSKKFIDVFEARKKSIYQGELFSVKKTREKKLKRMFFVSLFGPEDELVNIKNSKQWSIYLQSKKRKIFPTSIEKLDKRVGWSLFFPYINNWSQEYIVFFDEVSLDKENQIKSLNKNNLTLVLSNSQARTVVNW